MVPIPCQQSLDLRCGLSSNYRQSTLDQEPSKINSRPVVLLLGLGLVPPLDAANRHRTLLPGTDHVTISGKVSGFPHVEVRLVVLDEAAVVVAGAELPGLAGTGVDRIAGVMASGTSFPFVSGSILL